MANIAFDIDDTLYKVLYKKINDAMIPVRQVPDYEIINLLISLSKLGNSIYVWSAGGIDYAEQICTKLGIIDLVTIIEKSQLSSITHNIDITFDDQMVNLGKVNILIPRVKYE